MKPTFARLPSPPPPSTSQACARPPKKAARPQPPVEFDPKNLRHKEQLKAWCAEQWPATFRKSLQSGNAIHYHDCCSCFSRRAFCKLAGHPELQSSRLTRMPSFQDVSTADGLYHWVLARLTENRKRGHRTYMPAINRVHFDVEDLEAAEEENERELLRKRVDELGAREQLLSSQVAALKEQNELQLLATKTWYLKYQEAVERHDRGLTSAFTTPLKRLDKTNYGNFEDLF